VPLTIGTRLGAYEIVSPLGAGGMGEVYKARDTRLDRAVAIKIMPPGLATDPEFRGRFDREARAISQLSHPHICTLYDVGDIDGTAFLVLGTFQYLAPEQSEGLQADARTDIFALSIRNTVRCRKGWPALPDGQGRRRGERTRVERDRELADGVGPANGAEQMTAGVKHPGRIGGADL
jgi:serine/threonine protein kinase